MNPPANSQPPQSQLPASQAPTSTQQQQQQNSAPTTSTHPIPPRGVDFDISNLPNSSNSGLKKHFPAQWNVAWIVVAGLLAAYCLWLYAYGRGVQAQKPLPLGPIKTNTTAPVATSVTVYVAGAVARPGVYSLSPTARISDAITQAGGATPDADTTNLNLADFLQDGAQIIVPIRAVPTTNTAPANGITAVAPPSSLGTSPTSPNTLPAAATTPTTSPAAAQRDDQIAYLRAHPIDLNKASSFELQQLPGIGPAMADEIIAYRTNNGLFHSVSDLDNVKGIGEKRMETLKDLVVVR